MAGMRCKVVIAAVVLLACLSLNAAKITDAKIRRDDRPVIILAKPFGFFSNGMINVTLHNFALRSLFDPSKKVVSKPDLERCATGLVCDE